MAIVYGTDIQAIDDLPDPEVTCSESVNAAYACARRLMTPDGALADVGETQQYASVDVRSWLGGSYDLTDQSVINDLQMQATAALLEEPFAAGANVQVTFNGGTLKLIASIQGNPGPLFQLVLVNGAAGITTQLLLPGQT